MLLFKHRVEDYVDSTSGYQSMADTSMDVASGINKVPDEATHPLLLLHEYCVSPLDVDHFICLFRHTKEKLLLSQPP